MLRVAGATFVGLNTSHGVIAQTLTWNLRDISIIGIVRRAQIERAARRVRGVAAGRRARHRHAPQPGEGRAVAAPRAQEHAARPRRVRRHGRRSRALRPRPSGSDALHRAHASKGTVISTAGTVSNRMRGGRPSSVNSIRITPEDIEVSTLVWSRRRRRLRARTGQVLHALTSLLRAARPRRRRSSSSALRGRATPHERRRAARAAARSSGSRASTRCRLTRNRNVMVSFGGGELRVHEGYLGAPEPVLRAIVTFVEGRTRAERRAAQRRHRRASRSARAARAARRERTHPDDVADRRAARGVACSATTRGISTAGCKRCADPRLAPHEEPARATTPRRRRRRAGGDRDQPRAPAPPRLGGGAAHAAARDGASVAGRDRPHDRSRRDLPREGARGRDRAVRAARARHAAGTRAKARRRSVAARRGTAD